jgi:uncharacterized protein (TIGR02145 family)
VFLVVLVGFVIPCGYSQFKTVKIGDQVWMVENLNVDHYRNGDPIPEVKHPVEWVNLTTGAWCYYNNDPANGKIYGRLYNWYAVNDSRGLAPEGWHVPTDEEWKELEMYLGMSQSEADSKRYRGTNKGGKLKEADTTHWESPNTDATNEIGFTALPGGYRGHSGGCGYFDSMRYNAYFWSSTERGSDSAWYRTLNYSVSEVSRNYSNKHYGFSVRCVKDNVCPEAQ